MLSEISQIQKDKNHMTSLTCGIKTPPPSSSQRKTGVCQRQGVSKMGKGGQRYKLPVKIQLSHRKAVYHMMTIVNNTVLPILKLLRE